MKDVLLAECERLKQIMLEDHEGYAYWPDIPPPHTCGNCTNGAKRIAEKFGGYVAGYEIRWPADPIRLVAYDCCGHDFAIVGDYLVDWWAWEYENAIPCPVLHLVHDAAIIAEKYKPREEWELVNDFRPAALTLNRKEPL